MAKNDPWLEHHRGDLDHAANGALWPDNVSDDAGGHAVLNPGNKAVRLQIRRDQMARPFCIVGLEQQQHDVEGFGECRDVAKMEGPNRLRERFLRHLDAKAVIAHRRDVVGPLVDQYDIVSGPCQIGAN